MGHSKLPPDSDTDEIFDFGDVIRGADKIADVLYPDEPDRAAARRKVYHAHATRQAPIFKEGAILIARRKKLAESYAKREAEVTAA